MIRGRRGFIPFVVILLLASLVLPALALTGSVTSEPVLLRLRLGAFDPLRADIPRDLPGYLLQAAPDAAFAGGAAAGYYVVQFQGPILDVWLAELRSLGAEILEYIPDYAYVARLPASALDAARALPSVRWVGPWLPAFRVEPSLLPKLTATEYGLDEAQEPVEVRVATYPGINAEALLAELVALGVEPGPASQSDWGSTLRFFATPSQIADLARLPDVRWIEPYTPRELFNDSAQSNWLVGTRAIWDLGLYGQGQVVGVVTSAVADPATGRAVAMGFVKRSVEDPTALSVGA